MAFWNIPGCLIYSSSPPWAFTIAHKICNAFLLVIASSNICLAINSESVFLAWTNIWLPACKQSSSKSWGPFPFKVSIASLTSKLFPIAFPNGWDIFDIVARVSFPKDSPISIIVRAKTLASSIVFIKAPSPYLTSNKIGARPAANFFDIIDDAINGIQETVPVTSRSAYIFLSAGSRWALWPIIANWQSLTCFTNASSLIIIFNPGIDSNLSSVPPVCPSPRPLILATGTPHAATIGPNTNDVLSPTPPVLCLSTFIPWIALKSIISPLCIISKVNEAVSRLFKPWKQTAIIQALIW